LIDIEDTTTVRTALMVFQLICSVALILSILLHPAKSEGMAGIGGAAKVFGSQKGAESGLNKLTAGIAIVWAALAAVLSMPGLQF
jgi:preprotein translocase subunit SecG